jgi:hypothetical protein
MVAPLLAVPAGHGVAIPMLVVATQIGWPDDRRGWSRRGTGVAMPVVATQVGRPMNRCGRSRRGMGVATARVPMPS